MKYEDLEKNIQNNLRNMKEFTEFNESSKLSQDERNSRFAELLKNNNEKDIRLIR